MISGKKIAAVVVAYNAEKTLELTVHSIPSNTADDIIIVDDASIDRTFDIAKHLPLATVVRHAENGGYGAAQKTGYKIALERDNDIIVMIHGDFQYDPGLLPEMVRPLALGEADVCFGSRMQSKKSAWKNGMPWWRFVANIVLSKLEESIFHLELSEYHTGYRAYTSETLKRIPFEENSDDFVFDSQVFAQISTGKFRVAEIDIPTRYFKESLSIDFKRSVVYGIQTLVVMFQFLLNKNGIKKYKFFAIREKEEILI